MKMGEGGRGGWQRVGGLDMVPCSVLRTNLVLTIPSSLRFKQIEKMLARMKEMEKALKEKGIDLPEQK